MLPDAVEWQLRNIAAGSEILITDAHHKPVARGLLAKDRTSLSGPNGEHIALDQWQEGWQLTILRQPVRHSGGTPQVP